MKKKLWWFNNPKAKFPFNNRGEVEPKPDAPKPDAPKPDAPVAGSYADIAAKKGFKDQEAFAKNYTELEGDRSRKDTALQSAKTGVETQSQGTLTINEKGEVVPVQGVGQPGVGQPVAGQPGVGQPQVQVQYDGYGRPIQQGQQFQQEQVYDPYTGQIITNPIDRQLANMPLSQRMFAVVNAVNVQNEQNQSKAILAEGKVLSQEGAKGFEKDVQNIMMQLPLVQRSDEKKWEEALLKAKGAKFDWAMKNKGQQSIEEFLNKAGGQQLPVAPGAGDSSAQLTPEQETSYAYYEKNHPKMFRDRAHFKSRLSPTGDGAPARM